MQPFLRYWSDSIMSDQGLPLLDSPHLDLLLCDPRATLLRDCTNLTWGQKIAEAPTYWYADQRNEGQRMLSRVSIPGLLVQTGGFETRPAPSCHHWFCRLLLRPCPGGRRAPPQRRPPQGVEGALKYACTSRAGRVPGSAGSAARGGCWLGGCRIPPEPFVIGGEGQKPFDPIHIPRQPPSSHSPSLSRTPHHLYHCHCRRTIRVDQATC